MNLPVQDMVEAAAVRPLRILVCCLLACLMTPHPRQRAPVYVCRQEAQHVGLADNVGDVPLWHRAVRGLLPCRQAGRQADRRGTASRKGKLATGSP